MKGESTGHIPHGWSRATLGDVTVDDVIQDGTPKIAVFTYIDIGSVDNEAKRIVTPHTLLPDEAPSRARQRLRRQDVLVSMTRPNLNAVALVDDHLDGSIGSTGFHVLRATEGIHPSWLHLAVQTSPFIEAMAGVVQGALYPAVRPRDVRSWSLPIAPSAEQARVVAVVEELFSGLDAGAATLQKASRKLELYRASILKAAVAGSLTAHFRSAHPHVESAGELLGGIIVERRQRWECEQLLKYEAKGTPPPANWKQRYREPALPDPSRLRPLPNGWAWASVEQAGEVRLGRQRAPQHHTGDHMRPYLRVANVYEDRLELTDVKEMNFTPAEFDTYALRPGDILLNEGQSPELVGRPAMYKGEVPGCCYQKTLLRFRAHPGIEPAYALLVFRAYLHSGRFRQSASITTSIAHLAAERFVTIEMPIPPREEQIAIVELAETQLSVVDHLHPELGAQLKSAEALRQSVLRHAFGGKLVPQDANDEPASELLKRIADERGTRQPMPRKSRRRAPKVV